MTRNQYLPKVKLLFTLSLVIQQNHNALFSELVCAFTKIQRLGFSHTVRKRDGPYR